MRLLWVFFIGILVGASFPAYFFKAATRVHGDDPIVSAVRKPYSRSISAPAEKSLVIRRAEIYELRNILNAVIGEEEAQPALKDRTITIESGISRLKAACTGVECAIGY